MTALFTDGTAPSLTDIKKILETIRLPFITEEYEIQDIIAQTLVAHKIHYIKEYKLAPRNRIDFFLPGTGIGIEVKKKKPNYTQTYNQLSRYTSFPEIGGILLVVERTLTGLPPSINNKPCQVIGLNRLWGVAI